MVLVSILMPTYNNSEFLFDAITSILNQSYNNFELIIVNDASNDDTLNILNKFTDSRIKIINNKSNYGIVKSLNIALQNSSGEFIARMDGDDFCHKDKLLKQVSFLADNPNVGVCGTWVETFGKVKIQFKHPTESDDIKSELLFNSSLVHATMLVRRKLFEKVNFKYPDFLFAEDFSLLNTFGHFSDLANIPEILYFYRVHGSSVSQKYSSIQIESTKKIYKELLLNLKINASSFQIGIHFDLSKEDIRIFSRRFFLSFFWLIKLYLSNKKYKFYNVNSFNLVLYKYLRKLIKF